MTTNTKADKVEYRLWDLDGFGDSVKVAKYRNGRRVCSSVLCYSRSQAEALLAELQKTL
jgi:hypothetical protein